MDTGRAQRGAIPWDSVVPPYCDRCLTVMPERPTPEDDDFLQTTWHFYASCEALAALRLEMFGEAYYKPLEEIPRKAILEFARKADLNILPKDNSEVMEAEVNYSTQHEDA